MRSTFRHYSQFTTRAGLTGAQVATRILRSQGITDVRVEPVSGTLSDHYDPSARALRLSESVYSERSMAAFGVAAHEVGHAIQHARGYPALQFRSAWVPFAQLGGGLSMFVIMAAVFLGGASTATGATLSILGVGLFATTTVFTLITLPVEFDASRRALATLADARLVTSEELAGARKVLLAAALTYVAAFLASLLQLLYWLVQLGLVGGRDNDE